MSLNATASARYGSAAYTAAYLEADWSDWLFPDDPAGDPERLDPRRPVRSRFHTSVVEFIVQCIGEGPRPQRYADVGAGTGRTVFEWCRRFGDTAEVFLAEPSDLFGWAGRLLTEPETIGEVPTIGAAGRTGARVATGRPPRLDRPPVLLREPAERLPRPDGHFDLMTCLNVVDRHSDPRALVETLGRRVAPGGLFVLASPLDWDPSFTPEGCWVDDLRALFGTSWHEVGSTELQYDFRYSERKVTRYLTQVVGMRKA